ncbi:hypothetical protein TorRG33x02_034220 [Trema orientale]|uniref:Uncharacterized protein n=1 Tax=Trema orientale TaxID=63057 RepID=A0A2P5FSN9_TREOI|nr:hypothetical protein TorRG33x02_034220 [Trema orientale]
MVCFRKMTHFPFVLLSLALHLQFITTIFFGLKLEEPKENKLWGGCFEERVTDAVERILGQFWQIAATLEPSSYTVKSNFLPILLS